jgi:hypothetical protein
VKIRGEKFKKAEVFEFGIGNADFGLKRRGQETEFIANG